MNEETLSLDSVLAQYKDFCFGLIPTEPITEGNILMCRPRGDWFLSDTEFSKRLRATIAENAQFRMLEQAIVDACQTSSDRKKVFLALTEVSMRCMQKRRVGTSVLALFNILDYKPGEEAKTPSKRRYTLVSRKRMRHSIEYKWNIAAARNS